MPDEDTTKKSKADKKRFFKRLFLAIVVLSVFGTIYVTFANSKTVITQHPNPTNYFFIEDYSKVFTNETEQYIMEQSIALQNATKAQIVVVAVPDTQADSLENYSIALSNKWGIGDTSLDNGVLILFTTKEPHVRMEVGKGLEGCLPDGKAGRILDNYAVDAKDNRRWNEAAINTWSVVASVVYNEYGIDPPSDLVTVNRVNEGVSGTTFADADVTAAIVKPNENPLWLQIISAFLMFWMFSFAPFTLLSTVIYFGAFSRYSGRWYNNGGGFGGGFGGGGGFSGGGGSFGGGGASR